MARPIHIHLSRQRAVSVSVLALLAVAVGLGAAQCFVTNAAPSGDPGGAAISAIVSIGCAVLLARLVIVLTRLRWGEVLTLDADGVTLREGGVRPRTVRWSELRRVRLVYYREPWKLWQWSRTSAYLELDPGHAARFASAHPEMARFQVSLLGVPTHDVRLDPYRIALLPVTYERVRRSLDGWCPSVYAGERPWWLGDLPQGPP